MSNPRVPFRLSSARPPLPAPGGKRLIVHLVVAVESWGFDRKMMQRQILTTPPGLEVIPDIPNFTWAEYGMRCGLPRLLAELSGRGLRADACINSSVIETYPAAAEAILKAGWEFQGHGVYQGGMGQADERDVIRQAAQTLKRFTGVQPRGWLGPGCRETLDTPEVLRENGFDYVCDWGILDDLPCWLTTRHGPMVVVPYTMELNDAVIYMVENHSSEEMYNRLVDTLDCLEPELAREPRVVSLSLHHLVMGVPHRLKYVRKMLDLLQSRSDSVFMTGSEIADWFIAAEKAAGRGPNS